MTAPDDAPAAEEEGVGWLARGLALAFLIGFPGLWFYYQFYIPRSIVVDAETGTLSVELTAELSGKAFAGAMICRRREGPRQRVTGPRFGCPARTHELVTQDGFYTPVLPVGTRLRLNASPGTFRIAVLDAPDRYEEGTEIFGLVGGGIILTGDALDTFGSLNLRGRLQIGARHSETDDIPTVAGRYEIRGYTPTSLFDGDLRIIRSNTLMAGALIRFTGREETEDGVAARASVTLPDPETSLMRVTAISETAPHRLTIRYFFTDDVHLAPTLPEALIIDPLVQLLAAVLGATAGYGWLRKLVRVRRRGGG